MKRKSKFGWWAVWGWNGNEILFIMALIVRYLLSRQKTLKFSWIDFSRNKNLTLLRKSLSYLKSSVYSRIAFILESFTISTIHSALNIFPYILRLTQGCSFLSLNINFKIKPIYKHTCMYVKNDKNLYI